MNEIMLIKTTTTTITTAIATTTLKGKETQIRAKKTHTEKKEEAEGKRIICLFLMDKLK